MNHVIGFFTNYILVCAFTGWFGAQLIKCLLYFIRNHGFDFSLIMASGGMPSSHSATVCAVVTSVGRTDGTKSSMFALAFVMAFIVMYDAAGVRRAAGEQAKLLNRIVRDISIGEKKYLDRNLKELIGHTPLQVLVGAALGIVIPFLIPIF